MTIDELKEDVAYHCKSVHPRDNTAQTRIAKVLPELVEVLECAARVTDHTLPFGDYSIRDGELTDALDDFKTKLATITFA